MVQLHQTAALAVLTAASFAAASAREEADGPTLREERGRGREDAIVPPARRSLQRRHGGGSSGSGSGGGADQFANYPGATTKDLPGGGKSVQFAPGQGPTARRMSMKEPVMPQGFGPPGPGSYQGKKMHGPPPGLGPYQGKKMHGPPPGMGMPGMPAQSPPGMMRKRSLRPSKRELFFMHKGFLPPPLMRAHEHDGGEGKQPPHPDQTNAPPPHHDGGCDEECGSLPMAFAHPPQRLFAGAGEDGAPEHEDRFGGFEPQQHRALGNMRLAEQPEQPEAEAPPAGQQVKASDPGMAAMIARVKKALPKNLYNNPSGFTVQQTLKFQPGSDPQETSEATPNGGGTAGKMQQANALPLPPPAPVLRALIMRIRAKKEGEGGPAEQAGEPSRDAIDKKVIEKLIKDKAKLKAQAKKQKKQLQQLKEKTGGASGGEAGKEKPEGGDKPEGGAKSEGGEKHGEKHGEHKEGEKEKEKDKGGEPKEETSISTTTTKTGAEGEEKHEKHEKEEKHDEHGEHGAGKHGEHAGHGGHGLDKHRVHARSFWRRAAAPEPEAWADPEAEAWAEAEAEAYADAYPEADAHADAYPEAYPEADPEAWADAEGFYDDEY